MWQLLEPIHAFIYFVPEATSRYGELGLEPVAHYFASRSAAMGAVEHGVVTASFYNFSPGLVRRAMRDAWTGSSPAQVLAARLAAVDEVVNRAWMDATDIAEAADLASEAATACEAPGRPLYAGHASQPEPDGDRLRLWWALTLLREHRGDGHVIALQAEDFSPLDALLTSSDFSVLSISQLEKLRGWREHEWQAARADLFERGWLDEKNQRTDRGSERRQEVEALTDSLAAAPWAHLGVERTERLAQLLAPLRAAILSATNLPGTYDEEH